MSQWADRYRRLSSEASAEAGRWTTSRAEYQRGIMDAIGTHEVVVLMTSSQVGKTEIINNAVGYYIDQDPSPILLVQPILELAKAWSKDRLAPMVRDTPNLRNKVREAKSRDSENTVLHKVFPGGHITMAGANSAASLASRPIRVLLADEVDRYPTSAGTEGDPLRLARKRTSNFWNRRIIEASTPTTKGFSRIEKEWNASDKRFYMVPCAHCGFDQRLVWANVKWPSGEPTRAALYCEACGAEWSESNRLGAIRHGHWEATAVGDGKTAGFHLSELYSPWSTPATMATDFMAARGNPELMKTWVNTSLGEPYEHDAEKIDGHSLMARMEDWGAPAAPADVLIVTCGVDVQDDRFEVERVGWGVGEESWSLDHKIIYGDMSTPEVWAELDTYLMTPTQRNNGSSLPVHATCIDSGGHFTQHVYLFCHERRRRRVWAIKGASGPGRPVWPKRASKAKKGAAHANLFILGVDSAKDIVYGRARLEERGPGYSHFPTGRDQVYFDQFTAEQVVVRTSRGFPTRVYELPAGKRNEALDMRVYAYAALQSLNIRWGNLLARKPVGETSPQPVAPPPKAASSVKNAEAVREANPLPAQGAPRTSRPGFIPRRGSWLRR